MTRGLSLVVGGVLSAYAVAAPPDPAAPHTPAARGQAIAEQAEARDDGFGSLRTELEMILESADGRTRTRTLALQTLERPEGDRSLVVFHEPRDIAGTALLSHSRPGGEDDQWLYLPSLKRVKRIAAGNRSSAFVGSEFSYEDLMPERVEDFVHLWLRDEACGELMCHVLERHPRYRDSGYSRQVLWLDQEALRVIRMDYFDLKDRHLKTLVAHDFRHYQDHFWRAHELVMRNLLTHKLTRLTFAPFEFGAGLEVQQFEPSALHLLR